jgi:hypothetical protein
MTYIPWTFFFVFFSFSSSFSFRKSEKRRRRNWKEKEKKSYLFQPKSQNFELLTRSISSQTFQRNRSLESSCGIAALQTPLVELGKGGMSGKSKEGRRRGTLTPSPPPLVETLRVAAGSSVGREAAGGTTEEALASSWEGTPQRRV